MFSTDHYLQKLFDRQKMPLNFGLQKFTDLSLPERAKKKRAEDKQAADEEGVLEKEITPSPF